MKRILFWLTAATLLTVAALYAQTSQRTFTDVITPQNVSAGALVLYKSQVEGYLISDGNDIGLLKTNVSELQQQVATLQSQVKALMAAPPVPTGTTAAYMLAYSPSLNHSAGLPLQGATVKGTLQIYTAPAGTPANFSPLNVVQVSYMLDGVVWSNVEHSSPYDFNGGDVLWDTTKLTNGLHTISQSVTTTAGTTEVDSASFTVAN